MAAANMARGPVASPSLGDLPPYLAERAEGGEPKLVSPSQTHQGMSLVDDKPLSGQGHHMQGKRALEN